MRRGQYARKGSTTSARSLMPQRVLPPASGRNMHEPLHMAGSRSFRQGFARLHPRAREHEPMTARVPWPAHVRAEALDIAARESFAAASRATGVPSPTIRSWSRRAGQGVELAGMAWPERRETLVQQYGHAATEAGQKVREHLRKGKTADAKNCAIVAGIMSDKLLLCAGAATSRSETYSVNANAGSEQTYRASRRSRALIERRGRSRPARSQRWSAHFWRPRYSAHVGIGRDPGSAYRSHPLGRPLPASRPPPYWTRGPLAPTASDLR
jgi:hypothetical protein